MTKAGELEMDWYSPQTLANRADDGFRFVVRSTTKIICNLPSGVGYGVSKVGRVFFRRRKKTVMQQVETTAAAPQQQDASPQAAAGLLEKEAPSGRTAGAAAPAPCVCSQTASEQPALRRETRQEPGPRPPLDVEALLSEHAPEDKVTAIMLRKAVDDLLHGSEGARSSALETLVGQGQVAGPLLVACARESRTQVVESALEGLRLIDWPCHVSTISGVLESTDTELRIIALRAAGRLTDERKRPLLERGLRDPNARVRRRALSYLPWHDSSWAVAEIMRLCDDPQPDVKWAAVEALMTLRPSEGYNHLELMIPSLDPVHQRRAAALLAKRKDSTDKPPKAPTSQGRKRKRREPKKPSSDVKT